MRDAHLKLNPLLPWHKQHSKEEDSFQQQIGCVFKEETSKMHILSIALYGAATWTLRKVGQKYLESFKVWCLKRMEKMSLTDHVRNKEVLYTVKEERNIIHTLNGRLTGLVTSCIGTAS
jgi:hypothetical protein